MSANGRLWFTSNRSILAVLILAGLICYSPFAVYMAPYFYGLVFYDPPKPGEKADAIIQRLGSPQYSWASREPRDLDRPRRMGFNSPDGRRFIATLNENDVVMHVETGSR